MALFIVAAILVQLAVFILFQYLRHKRVYRLLETDSGAIERPDKTLPVSAEQAAAWEGFRDFVVQRRVMEDDANSTCSFYLVPGDGQPLPLFKPGQFLTFRLRITDQATGESKEIVRCYSLSDRPRSDYYRVTIKRLLPPLDQPHVPPGIASNFFHDHVQIGTHLSVKAPSGQFHLFEDEPLPVVLVAGGIGLTPMLSIVNSMLHNPIPREVWLFYGVRNRAEHLMQEHLTKLAETHRNFHLHVCYSRATTKDVAGVDYQHSGHVDIQRLRLSLQLTRYQFYVCGPRAMMENLVPALEQWGVHPVTFITRHSVPPACPGMSNTNRLLQQERRHVEPLPSPSAHLPGSWHGIPISVLCWSLPRTMASKWIRVAGRAVVAPVRQ